MTLRLIALLSGALLLSACNQAPPPAQNDAVKQSIDQLVGIEREHAASAKATASATQGTLEEIRKLTSRMETLERTLSNALSNQKRGALYLPLEAETVCDNDALCNNTARAVCGKVNYPNGLPSKYTPGTRPMLNSVVCFD